MPNRRKRGPALGAQPRRGFMLSLVNRVSGAAMTVVVVVCLAVAAIVQQSFTKDRATLQPNSKDVLGHTAPSAPMSMTPPTTSKPPARKVSPTILLDRQVQKVALVERGDAARRVYGTKVLSTPVVRRTRVDRRRAWAFGTEAIPPANNSASVPEAAPFLAHSTGRTWNVALAGTTAFTTLARRAPTTVLPAAERTALERYNAAVKPPKQPPPLALPWTRGQSWTIRSSENGLSFQGGDGRVLAATAGRLYRVCSTAPDHGLVMVVGNDGTAVEYYQLNNLTKVPDGGLVKQGDFLGHTSTEQPCGGGDAQRSLVRFGLRGSAAPIPVDGLNLGGWVIHLANTGVYAQRNGVRVTAGNPLLNFGVTLPSALPSLPLIGPSPSPKPSGKASNGTS